MPRSHGFARGDIDTAFPLDDKFLALRGRLSIERYYAATGVYFHVVAATWREGERKAAIRVVPDAADLIDELIAVGLLDPDGRVPNRAFTNHIGRARRQRKASTERQARNRAEKSREVTPLSRVTTSDTAPLRSVGTEGTETGGAGGVNDPWDAPEVPILAFLSQHGCHIRPGDGYHQRLVTAVEVHGVAPLLDVMGRLFAAGTKRGDTKGLLFGAIDSLNAASRPNLKTIAPPRVRPVKVLEPWELEFRAAVEAHEAGLDKPA